jgi:hypothetical protein
VKLLDAAAVQTGTGDWTKGWDGESRACGNVSMYLADACDTVNGFSDVIGTAEDTGTVSDCGYRVIPFGLVAELTRGTRTLREDDPEWLRGAFMESAEIGIARGLLVRQGRGGVLSDVWLGNDAVEGIPAPALTDNDALADAVSDGRRRFFQKTIGVRPILHVNPTMAIRMKKAGVVELDPANGEDRTAWGDQVVISNGYYDIPDLTAVPVAFWTAPIEVTLSEITDEDMIRAVRQNRATLQVTMLAAIDTPPCGMVRIGAAPAPVAP